MGNWQDTLNSRDYRFAAQVDEFASGTKKRIDALFRASVQDVINQAQTPMAQGGRMRVDTGYLRASGQLSLNGMPSGPARGEKGGAYNYDPGATEAVLAGAEAGATLYWGWVANYAKYREAYDGFLIAAVQNWQQIVDKQARRIWWRSPAGGGKQ